jgi:hypothetical protein
MGLADLEPAGNARGDAQSACGSGCSDRRRGRPGLAHRTHERSPGPLDSLRHPGTTARGARKLRGRSKRSEQLPRKKEAPRMALGGWASGGLRGGRSGGNSAREPAGGSRPNLGHPARGATNLRGRSKRSEQLPRKKEETVHRESSGVRARRGRGEAYWEVREPRPRGRKPPIDRGGPFPGTSRPGGFREPDSPARRARAR